MESGIWNEILTAAGQQSALEWLALITNLIYVILAAKGNRWCWWFGGIGAAASLVVLANVNLYSDATLQVYYFAMAIYGWFAWNAHQEEQQVLIESMTIRQHFQVVAVGSILAFLLGWFWTNFGAAFPYVDGTTTAFSLLATLLVARRYIENWLYWIVIDIVGIGIYYVKELYLFSFLFIIYTVIAFYGWLNWRKRIKKAPAA